jgi:hypothetical protein
MFLRPSRICISWKYYILRDANSVKLNRRRSYSQTSVETMNFLEHMYDYHLLDVVSAVSQSTLSSVH